MGSAVTFNQMGVLREDSDCQNNLHPPATSVQRVARPSLSDVIAPVSCLVGDLVKGKGC